MNIMSKTCQGFRVVAWARAVLLIAIGAMFLGLFNERVLAEPVWENGEYLIYTSADLKDMADWVNGSQVSPDARYPLANAKYRLMEDIDLGGIEVPWLPIGARRTVFFNGEFNGGGHVIHNFVISRDMDYIGLFSVISGDAKISDLKVISFDIIGKEYVGGLAGQNNSGTIRNSCASGTVNGNERVGGFVGYNYEGTIHTSYASGAVDGDMEAGGLVGRNTGTIHTSYASGAVSGNRYVGGLVGWNYGQISTNYASGAVSGDRNIGGLVGQNNRGAIITSSYASGTVSGNELIGGLVGWNFGTIDPSYWLQDAPANINAGLKGVGSDDNVISTNVTSLDLAGMANRASFKAVSWDFYGDQGVTNPDWCYMPLNNGTAPMLFAFDPASASTLNIKKTSENSTQPVKPQASEVRWWLQFGKLGFKELSIYVLFAIVILGVIIFVIRKRQ